MPKLEKCECCQQYKSLHQNNGKRVCTSCVVLRGSVKLRPQVVVNCLRELCDKSLVSYLNIGDIEEIKRTYSLAEKVDTGRAEEIISGLERSAESHIRKIEDYADQIKYLKKMLFERDLESERKVADLERVVEDLAKRLKRADIALANR